MSWHRPIGPNPDWQRMDENRKRDALFEEILTRMIDERQRAAGVIVDRDPGDEG